MKSKKKFERMYFIIFKVLLILAAIISVYNQNWFNLLLVFTTTLLVLIPNKKQSTMPNKLEIFILLLIYLSTFFGKTEFVENAILWARVFLYFIISLIIGIIGFALIYILNEEKKSVLRLNPLFIASTAFCFSLTIGAIWQIFRFGMDYVFQINIQNYNPSDALGFLAIHLIGAGITSLIGYSYLRSDDDKYFIKKILKKFIWKDNEVKEEIKKETISMIKKGESKKCEFKSTLRTNVHTNEHDKRIEHSAFKTIAAFLNSEGGTLIIGVDDEKKVVGLDKDNFKNDDKLYLHFTNLIKQFIGHEFISFLRFDLIPIKDKKVLRIDCKSCDKEVFLKNNNEEEFYIRSGPSSVQLNGSKLLSYVKRRFKK